MGTLILTNALALPKHVDDHSKNSDSKLGIFSHCPTTLAEWSDWKTLLLNKVTHGRPESANEYDITSFFKFVENYDSDAISNLSKCLLLSQNVALISTPAGTTCLGDLVQIDRELTKRKKSAVVFESIPKDELLPPDTLLNRSFIEKLRPITDNPRDGEKIESQIRSAISNVTHVFMFISNFLQVRRHRFVLIVRKSAEGGQILYNIDFGSTQADHNRAAPTINLLFLAQDTNLYPSTRRVVFEDEFSDDQNVKGQVKEATDCARCHSTGITPIHAFRWLMPDGQEKWNQFAAATPTHKGARELPADIFVDGTNTENLKSFLLSEPNPDQVNKIVDASDCRSCHAERARPDLALIEADMVEWMVRNGDMPPKGSGQPVLDSASREHLAAILKAQNKNNSVWTHQSDSIIKRAFLSKCSEL